MHKTTFAALTAAFIMLAPAALASHPAPGTPTTTWNVSAGTVSCDTVNGHTASTPVGGSFRVGAPNHVHATLTLNVQNNGPGLCWGRIVLGTPTAVNVPVLDPVVYHQKDDGQCGPVATGNFCTATGAFAFTRPRHNVAVFLPYCIELSLDGRNWFSPAESSIGIPGSDPEERVCNQFRFYDPPVVEGGADVYADEPLANAHLLAAGERIA